MFISETTLENVVDWTQTSLHVFLLSALFNPLYWNTVARLEYKYRVLTTAYGCGNSRRGCYVLAATIFSLGILRDYLFKVALEDQPDSWPFGLEVYVHLFGQPVAVALVLVGNVFVVSSMYQLGITGTYLGDYFGILMKHRVTSFPFNVLDNPMYQGSTMVFLGTALWYQKFAGVVMAVCVWMLYQIALAFEGPFTSMIYRNANSAKNNKSPAARRRQKMRAD